MKRANETTGWQPIATAPPKSRVLAWRPAYKCACEVWVDDFSPGYVVEPITGKSWTAEWWMPVPPAPPGQERNA